MLYFIVAKQEASFYKWLGTHVAKHLECKVPHDVIMPITV